MTELERFYGECLAGLETLPNHDAAAMQAAAHHLRMLQYQPLVDGLEKDFLFLTRNDVRAELERLYAMPGEDLRRHPWAVDTWAGGAQAGENQPAGPLPAAVYEENKRRRMGFLLKEFRRLCLLRSEDPQAWDEIHELYYDD